MPAAVIARCATEDFSFDGEQALAWDVVDAVKPVPTHVAFIPVWIAIVHRHLPTPKVVVSLVLVLVGLAILADLDLRTLKLGRGETETIIGSVLFVGQILMLERPRYATNDPLRFSVVMFVMMALLCVPGVWFTTPNPAACLRAFASPAACGSPS